MTGNKTLHAVISGVVQGVNFRTFTAHNARLLKLTGYVHNLDSGKVEVVAEGNEENLVQLLAKLCQVEKWPRSKMPKFRGDPRPEITKTSVFYTSFNQVSQVYNSVLVVLPL